MALFLKIVITCKVYLKYYYIVYCVIIFHHHTYELRKFSKRNETDARNLSTKHATGEATRLECQDSKSNSKRLLQSPDSTPTRSGNHVDMEGFSPELLTAVFSALEGSDAALLVCEQVSKRWRNVILSSPIYRLVGGTWLHSVCFIRAKRAPN